MGFPRQEYWSGLPFPSPGDLPNPGTEPESYAIAGGFFTTEPPEKPSLRVYCVLNTQERTVNKTNMVPLLVEFTTP